MTRALLLSLAVASIASAVEPDALDAKSAEVVKRYSNVTVTREGATTTATIDLGSLDWRQPKVRTPFMEPLIALILAANKQPERKLQLIVLARGGAIAPEKEMDEVEAHAKRCSDALRSGRFWTLKNVMQAQVAFEVRCLDR
jgi:hypothetical protein